MFGSHGRFRAEQLHAGDVGYIPQGLGHSIENVGGKPSRILIGFNTGTYQAIDLSAWIAGNPVDVLATNFGKPASLFEKFPAKTFSYRRINNVSSGVSLPFARHPRGFQKFATVAHHRYRKNYQLTLNPCKS